MKICRLCNIEKNDDDFRKGRRQCKKCEYEKNKERNIENTKKWRDNKKQSKEYTFYKIILNGKILYIGSAKYINNRISSHKVDCFDCNRKLYHLPLYQYIRDNEINFNEIIFEIIEKFNMKNKTHRFKRERYWIEMYDTFNNGFNDTYPYKTEKEKNETKQKHMRKYRVDGTAKMRSKKYNNSEKGKQKNKEFYEKNKDKIKEKNKEKIQCPQCNLEMNKKCLSRHKRRQHKTI